MSEKQWIDERHYRVTSEDGRRSYLYRIGASESQRPKMLEIQEHRILSSAHS